MSEEDNSLDIFGDKIKRKSPKNELPALTKNKEIKRKVSDMIDRMTGMNNAIEDKVDQLSRSRGLTKEQIWQFIGNEAHFSPKEWEMFQAENQSMVSKVWGIVEGQPVPTTSPTPGTPGTPGNRKGKYVGARQKWIPTR